MGESSLTWPCAARGLFVPNPVKKKKKFKYALAHHCPPNYSFYKPAAGSYSKTTIFNILLQTADFETTLGPNIRSVQSSTV